MQLFRAVARRAQRLAPAASSETRLFLPVIAYPVPLALPWRTPAPARHATLHHTAPEPLDRSSPRMGLLVRIVSQNPCTASGAVHYRASRQGYPCASPLRGTERLLSKRIVTVSDRPEKKIDKPLSSPSPKV